MAIYECLLGTTLFIDSYKVTWWDWMFLTMPYTNFVYVVHCPIPNDEEFIRLGSPIITNWTYNKVS